MTPPRATMRLQLNPGFRFADAAGRVPYLAALGISHLYLSPITTARSGSTHGYDVVDPTRVNPELGGEDGLRALAAALRRHEMGLIVDIVPNHMAASSENPWWLDVLARGRESRYAKFFDIDWTPPQPYLHGKVMLPILGRPYGEALAAGEIVLERARGAADFAIRYFDHLLPLTDGDRAQIANDPGQTAGPHDPASLAGLHALLERQHYRLAWWRAANDEINWRRFFDINDLVALRMEDDEVFEAAHATLFRFAAEGLIDGVRVDHIDGLADPAAYCRKLRRRLDDLQRARPDTSARRDVYLVVEKILGRGERLPKTWGTDGTTGYDFMDEISAVQHDPQGEQPLCDLWQRVSGRTGDFAAEELIARRQILRRSFSSQRDALVDLFHRIAQGDLNTRDFSSAAIGRGLDEILAHFPVYRIYARLRHAGAEDLAVLSRAVAAAKLTCLPGDRWMVDRLGQWLSGEPIRPAADRAQEIALTRFQQLSAPLSAKAVEDTAFYRYGRLLSRNDVGFDTGCFARTPAQFHAAMQARAAAYPNAMLATATHDHKRGEDTRARLAVLSELAQDWARNVERWLSLGGELCAVSGIAPLPSAGDLAMLFQTIVGAWPFGLADDDRVGLAAFGKRIAGWQEKALREAKLESDWSCPNEAYEHAAAGFVRALFGGPSPLLTEIASFARRIAPPGAANSLAQTLVKLTAPGVADFYQGRDFWDFSLVDPDNRRQVDYPSRQHSLASGVVSDSTLDWTDRRFKQALIACVLNLRKRLPRLFSDGSYLPLQTEGPLANHVVAFGRKFERTVALVAFCRLPICLLGESGAARIDPERWSDTAIRLPPDLLAFTFADALLDVELPCQGSLIPVSRILPRFPVALLTSSAK